MDFYKHIIIGLKCLDLICTLSCYQALNKDCSCYRSEYCRNVKLKYCLEADTDWAKEFREKVKKPASEGGFTGAVIYVYDR